MVNHNNQELLKRIEQLREQMNDLSKTTALNDPAIIKISQHLDGLLNEYELYKNQSNQ